MKERLYNLYALVERGIIEKVGIREYRMAGSEEEKEAFLASRAGADCSGAKIFPVPDNYITFDLMGGREDVCGIPWECYRGLIGTGEEMGIYEMAFREVGAPMMPFVRMNMVIDGVVAGE
ncbi:MAG: hypothetical protein JW838_04060 [Spirochaetes bacterium]|nr:hypothetical protein [Spirochaetota bacterium]